MSWHTPVWFVRCTECGAEFDGTRAEIARAIKAHGLQRSGLAVRHDCQWVAVCGCGREFPAGSQAGAAKLLKAHTTEQTYEPVELFGGGV